MSSSKPKRRTRRAPIRTVGLRIRKLRRARGMSPLALAQPEFTKRYLRAVERCSIIPSLRVIELFARKLDVSVPQILRANVAQHTGSGLTSERDLGALQEDLNYQLNYAKMLIKDANQSKGKLEEALEGIRLADAYVASAGPHASKLPAQLLYRIPQLRGLAYVQSHNPGAALPELKRALALIEGDEEKAATVRNLLGAAYYLQERPDLAIKEHLICLRAVQTDVLRDLSSRFSIYRNLANDYWALGDAKQALATYKLALPILQDLNDPARKAGIFEGMGMVYREMNDLVSAILWTSRAREIYQEVGNSQLVAHASLNLAELMVLDQRFGEAEPLLTEVAEITEGAENPPEALFVSQFNRVRALSALSQRRLDKAAEFIQISLELGEKLSREAADECAVVANSYEGTDKKAYPGSACYPIRSYVEALHVAADIAEARGDHAAADETYAKALEWASKTGSPETVHNISLEYARRMEERGALQSAMEYYKAAAEANLPLKRKHVDRAAFVG